MANTSRPAAEIKMRCEPIIKDEKIVWLVENSSSPSAAYELVFSKTGDTSKAKAARWLAILKRDYTEEYKKTLSKTD